MSPIPFKFPLDSYAGLAQSAFNISSLPIDIQVPEVRVPSFDEARNATLSFYEEHPEEVKAAGMIVLLALAIVIGLCFVLPALSFVFAAVVTCLTAIYNFVMMVVVSVFSGLKYLFLLLAADTLHVVGFTANGVAAGSAAASVQSVVYGGLTGGLFSVLQALGAVLGRVALAVV